MAGKRLSPEDVRAAIEISAERIEEEFDTPEELNAGDYARNGPDLGLRNAADIADHVEGVLADPETKGFVTAGNTDIYYHEPSNTLVFIDHDDIFASGTERPVDREEEFERLLEQENIARREAGLPPAEVSLGGLDALEEKLEAQPEPQLEEKPFTPVQALDPGLPLTEQSRVAAQSGVPQPTSAVMDILDGGLEAFEEVLTDTVKEITGIYGALGGVSALDREAAYFADCVEDPGKFPPLNEEMKQRADSRRAEEAAWRENRSANGGSPDLTPAGEAWIRSNRVETYMNREQDLTL
jgi:hypothetical protein